MKSLKNCGALLGALALPLSALFAQPEVTPWGNVIGQRIEGQKVPFETALRLVDADWKGFAQSSKYNWEGKVTYERTADGWHCAQAIAGSQIKYSIHVRPTSAKSFDVLIDAENAAAVKAAGLYFTLDLPYAIAEGGQAELIGADSGKLSLAPAATALTPLKEAQANGVRFTNGKTVVSVKSANKLPVILRRDAVNHPAYLNDPKPRLSLVAKEPFGKPANAQAYFQLAAGEIPAGAKINATFSVEVDTAIDNAPVEVSVDTRKLGRHFEGIAGNFRLQFPDKDYPVIDYCLANLPVRQGRIAMWWTDWQPEEGANPWKGNRQVTERIQKQAELAKKLQQSGAKIIVSAWDPPKWAIDHSQNPPKGYRLAKDKLQAVASSIADYLQYLKTEYGVEAIMFSFNETDVGVDVLQSPEEHAEHNKIIGAELVGRGLATKMLIGDTGHGTAHAAEMVAPSQKDPAVRQYAHSLAFHTYHGCTDSDLDAWRAAADGFSLPLIVAELGPDSAAHRYAAVFTEPWFQFLEAELTLRICERTQPSILMPWQLTSDYSLLTGNGIYGTTGPLRPTQRFWTMKQLSLAPDNSFWAASKSTRTDVHAAVLSSPSTGGFVAHLLNNGAAREAVVRGIPAGITKLKVKVLNSDDGIADAGEVTVTNGEAKVSLKATSLTSVTTL